MKIKTLCMVLTVCLMIPCLCLLSACGDNNKDGLKSVSTSFCLLEKNQTLNIGSNTKFTNSIDTRTEEYYLTYPVSATVNLRRYSSNSYNNTELVQYGSSWYWWEVTTNNDNILLGHKIITTTKVYSYLVYGTDNTDIVVKSTTRVETTYDFQTGSYSKPCDITYNLNGYFTSISVLKSQAPELYNALTVSSSNNFYVAEIKTTYNYTENTYNNTYFYFS